MSVRRMAWPERMSRRSSLLASLGYALALAAWSQTGGSAANVDMARLRAADREPGQWMSPGRTFGEQHFSPLKQIDAEHVQQLGLAWYYDLDTAHRGQESTPLEIDGVLYVTSAWSKVFALNARTGK